MKMDYTLAIVGKGQKKKASAMSRYANATLDTFCLLLFCTLVLLWRLPITTNSLYTPSPTFQFGRVTAGERIKHDFAVRNLHPWPVTITAVIGGCGCIQSFPGKEVPFQLKPLETVYVSTVLDSYGKDGSVNQTVQVITNDNSTGTPLSLSGTVYSNSQRVQ